MTARENLVADQEGRFPRELFGITPSSSRLGRRLGLKREHAELPGSTGLVREQSLRHGRASSPRPLAVRELSLSGVTHGWRALPCHARSAAHPPLPYRLRVAERAT
jgi:hypothetical protein